VLKPGGILVTPVGQPDPAVAAAHGVRGVALMTQPNAEQLAEIARLMDAGTVKSVVSEVFPLSEARRAHELLEGGHTRGKLVLRVV
jgi:NADPH:quinone reductase-like Zn-dependent oxidoreductase